MVQKYVAKKWPDPTKLHTFCWTVFHFNAPSGDYLPEGKKRMSIGQMLCLMECGDLENWKFIGQDSICDYTITRYFYPAIDDDYCDVELVIVENHTPSAPQIVRRKTKCVKNDMKNRRTQNEKL